MASQGVCIFRLVAVPKWLSIKVVPVKRPPAVCEPERCHQPSASVIPQRVWFYKAALRGDRSAHLWVSSQAAPSRQLRSVLPAPFSGDHRSLPPCYPWKLHH